MGHETRVGFGKIQDFIGWLALIESQFFALVSGMGATELRTRNMDWGGEGLRWLSLLSHLESQLTNKSQKMASVTKTMQDTDPV